MNRTLLLVGAALAALGFAAGRFSANRYAIETVAPNRTIKLDRLTGQTWRYYLNRDTEGRAPEEGWGPLHDRAP
jgi:hypothetical protein